MSERIQEIVKRMKMRNELMRATKHPHYADDIAENEFVIGILQEKLERKEPVPLTCEGCVREGRKYGGLFPKTNADPLCDVCVRKVFRKDNYEPKGEPND